MPEGTIEQPQGNLRQEVLNRASTLLDQMSAQIDAVQRSRVTDLIRAENLSQDILTMIDTTLDRAQQEFKSDPNKAIAIMNALADTTTDGKLSSEELERLGASTGTAGRSQGVEKIGGMVERMSGMMEQLGTQMGGLGSGTLKMLEGMFGGESFFGKIFGYLKNTPKAQAAYIEKKLSEQQKTLASGVTAEQVAQLMRTQIIQAQNMERRAKQTPIYDIVQHMDQVMANIAADKREITLDDLRVAGETALNAYQEEVSQLPPPAPTENTASTERPRVAVGATLSEMEVTRGGKKLQLSRDATGVHFETQGKKASLEKIADTNITNVETMAATDKDPAVVVLTLANGTRIDIAGTELILAADDATKKALRARNMTTNTETTLEIQFS